MNFRSVHIQVDSQTALSHLLKIGGTKSQELLRVSKEIWDYLLKHQIMITAEYLPSLPKSSGRLGVEKSKGFHSVEIMSERIPENLPEGGSTRDRSICFSVVQSAPSLLLMEARAKQFGPRCIAANLVAQIPLCFSPIFTDTISTKEDRVGESPFFDTDSNNFAEPGMVPRVTSFVNEKSPTLTSTSKSLKEPSR